MGLKTAEVDARRLHNRGFLHLGVGGWILVSCLTVLLAIFIRAFVAQTFKIPSSSMTPTLLVGDLILVNKLSYGLTLPGMHTRLFSGSLPQKRDVVVFYRFSEFEDVDSDKHYIKRIAAVPGEIVEVKDFTTYVNGEAVQYLNSKVDREALLSQSQSGVYGPVKLRDGEYFVLGDNRDNSQDSRYFGPIHLSDIQGKAVYIFWSWKPDGSTFDVRWERVGTRIN